MLILNWRELVYMLLLLLILVVGKALTIVCWSDGIDFFIPFLFLNHRNGFFSLPSHSQIFGMELSIPVSNLVKVIPSKCTCFESRFWRAQWTSIRSIEREADECFPTKSWPSGILPWPRSLRPSSSALYCMQAVHTKQCLVSTLNTSSAPCTLHNIHTICSALHRKTRDYITLHCMQAPALQRRTTRLRLVGFHTTTQSGFPLRPPDSPLLTFTHLQRSAADRLFRHSLSLGSRLFFFVTPIWDFPPWDCCSFLFVFL